MPPDPPRRGVLNPRLANPGSAPDALTLNGRKSGTKLRPWLIWGVNSAKSSVFSFVCQILVGMSKTHLTVRKNPASHLYEHMY